MQKIFLLLTIVIFAACNNSSRSGRNTGTEKANGLPADSTARVATFSFIDGCMENARLTLGDAKAYAFCKCIYQQLKTQNPGADSIQIEELATDTARVAKMAANCR